jgi:hypothetical protein
LGAEGKERQPLSPTGGSCESLADKEGTQSSWRVGVWTTQGEQSEPYSFYYTICIPPVQVKTWKLSLLLIPSSTGQPRVVKCPQRAREGRQIIPDWETEPEKISHRKLCLNLVLKFGGSCHGPGVGRWGCGDGGKYVTFMSRYGGLLKSCKEEVTQGF